MNGLVLLLAMVGQQCPGGSCDQFGRPVDPPVRSRIESPPGSTSWHDYAVRVIVNHGDSQSLGSGTVICEGETGEKLVITARLVLGNARSGISVRHRGNVYPARWLATGAQGDIAAVAANIPGTFPDLRIADTAPSKASMLGYGSNGQLHQHSGRRTGLNLAWPNMEFSFGAESGDSGGGIFDDQGRFAGVLWGTANGSRSGAVAVQTAAMHRFLGVTLTNQTPGTPGSSGKIVTFVPPFFFKVKRWNNAPQQPGVIVQNPPANPPASPPPDPSPGPAVVGVKGDKGDKGDTGAAGKDAPATDLTAINNRLTALEASNKALATTMDKVSQAVVRPITFAVVKSDGTTASQAAQLGSTLTLDVTDKALQAKIAAIEARLATLTGGK